MMRAVCVLALVCLVAADVYMHNMRGSNNRLNERSANRNNGNRLFDSQNNNRGGYNVGDATKSAAGNDASKQYQMTYYAGSEIPLEWTNQHGCGNPKLNCNMVLQYMCNDVFDTAGDKLRDGTSTGTINENGQSNANGRHENADYYADCKARQRNFGLFTADQNLNGNTAKYTRQNPGGTRRGLECPEERDYYPYWHPSPFTDIAVLTDDTSRCPYYQAESQNVKEKYSCETNTFNNENDCPAGEWKATQPWATRRAPAVLPPLVCQSTGFSRVNHLGNGPSGQPLGYLWTVPTPEAACGQTSCTCVLRLRYNMSSTDYDWNVNASLNGNQNVRQGQPSPVQQNPTLDLGGAQMFHQGLRFAINTAQFGRTFQDRSHTFKIVSKPSVVTGTQKIINLNVRGKRCNIVQCFPAVEYDFVPNSPTVSVGDWVHWQWTGSNTHNNGNPAGDGQAGDDGQGTGGTDRHNVVQMNSLDVNYPTPAVNNTLWPSTAALTFPRRQGDKFQMIKDFALVGTENAGVLLNDAPASYNGGLTQMTTRGTFHFMCTRNNNFSNRSQKGSITVQ